MRVTDERIRELLGRHGIEPEGPDDPIDIDSLTMVALVEDLEEELRIEIAADDIGPDNFATLGRLVAYCARSAG